MIITSIVLSIVVIYLVCVHIDTHRKVMKIDKELQELIKTLKSGK